MTRLRTTAILTGQQFNRKYAGIGNCNPFTVPGLAGFSDATINAYLDDMIEGGQTWIRTDFNWSYFEPTQGNFVYTNGDRFVNLVTAKGLKILAILCYSNNWANGNQGSTYPPNDNADFKNYCKKIVQRYSNKVRYFEVWNEANISAFWKPGPNTDQYAALLKAAYEGVKEADSTATVLMTGTTLSTTNEDSATHISVNIFMDRLYQLGCKDYFDIMNYHAYDWNNRTIQTTIDVMKKYGDGNKKWWITEYGYPTGGTSGQAFTDEAGQATIIGNGMKYASNLPVIENVFVYCYIDPVSRQPDREGYFGMRRGDGTRKPSWYTAQSYKNRTLI